MGGCSGGGTGFGGYETEEEDAWKRVNCWIMWSWIGRGDVDSVVYGNGQDYGL